MLSPQILLAVLAALVGLVYLSSKNRRAGVHGIPAPPVVPSWFPWLGNVVQVASGGDSFFKSVAEKYGPIYELTLLGDRRIYISSPQAISYIYKQAKLFEFHPIRMDFQNRIFGMSAGAAHAPAMVDRVFPMHHKLLSPSGIGELVMRNAVLAEETLIKAATDLPTSGKELELTEFVFDHVYAVSAAAYLGKTFPSSASIPAFHRFDKGFPILSLSLPAFMTGGPQKAREEMINLISAWWTKDGRQAMSDVPEITREMMDIADAEGMSLRDRSSLLLGELWALEANAPYAAMWAISFILRTPTLVEALREEITKAISAQSPPKLSTLLQLPAAQLPPLVPLLSSCIQETLRLRTSSFSIRRVTQDTVLPPSVCGEGIGKSAGLSVRQDDVLICQTRQGHLDTEGWGTDANKWKAERFLDQEGVKAVKGSMSPFGGGVSMCEGRHFAQSEITIFLIAFLQMFDVSILPGGDTLEPDTQRIGLGILHRKGGLKVRLNRR